MANHQVIVQTSGGQGGTFNPPSLTVDPNDQITFTSQHQPKFPPVQLVIKFTSGNICSSADSLTIQNTLVLPGNTSSTVQVCAKIKSSQVDYELVDVDKRDPEGEID